MKRIILLLLAFVSTQLSAQTSIKGTLQDESSSPIMFSNVVLYASSDSSLVKVESSDVDGKFLFNNIPSATYYVVSSFIGYDDLRSADFTLGDSSIDLGVLKMTASSVQLETAVVKASRALVEVKPDRTVFNVEGTINSAGDDALGLLRKAPGVMVDNNNNISVLSRTGVLIYVDGKRLPLTGDDLTAYLNSLPAEQIDRMDIITNPGAKYEAQGNAGIIDIRLKRDKSHGMNGSISGSLSQGQFFKGNISSFGNYRNKRLNSFGSIGYNGGKSFNRMLFINNQNSLRTNDSNYSENLTDGINYRWGTDFFFGKHHTVGFLLAGQNSEAKDSSENIIEISKLSNITNIDSILFANSASDQSRKQTIYNLNYIFDNREYSINFDLDYGRYRNDISYVQPNRYFESDRKTLLTEILTEYDTPVDINIYTGKVDFETNLAGGRISLGSKVSKVDTDNTFLFYDVIDGQRVRNDRRSNIFYYDENVYAGYVSYQKPVNEKLNLLAGLRVETTDATGDLVTFLPELQEDPVDLNYTDLFPTAGLTYNLAYNKTISLNYGRRINRPDYNVLNPFIVQLSELSFLKGNESLRPERVNNIELGYTLNFRYNFKLSYSRTTDQITRLIAPDDVDPRAGINTWANLSEQTIYSFNLSAPFSVNKWWSVYLNLNAGYLNNQADYGDGAIVDVQAFTYTNYQQHTFTLPRGFVGEISGWYAGPGVWGGVFEFDSSYSLNFGLQKRFFNNLMNVKLSANDVTYQSKWTGKSNFDGLEGVGSGSWDSRRVSLSVSYNFGNSNVKSRRRSTGIEDESKRVK